MRQRDTDKETTQTDRQTDRHGWIEQAEPGAVRFVASSLSENRRRNVCPLGA